MRSNAARSSAALSETDDNTAHNIHIGSTDETRKGMGSVTTNSPGRGVGRGMMVSGMSLRLSVLDQSPISQGMSVGDALRNSIDLARLVDGRGFNRYWVAEHHGIVMLAGTSPEILIGPIA